MPAAAANPVQLANIKVVSVKEENRVFQAVARLEYMFVHVFVCACMCVCVCVCVSACCHHRYVAFSNGSFIIGPAGPGPPWTPLDLPMPPHGPQGVSMDPQGPPQGPPWTSQDPPRPPHGSPRTLPEASLWTPRTPQGLGWASTRPEAMLASADIYIYM